MTGLQIVVDGVGLERPRAGVGVYTTQILRAMSVDRPDCRMTVFGPPGAFIHVPNSSYRPLPRTGLLGRHLQWPARIRQLKPDAYFGPAGVLPLGDVGCPSVITIHDLAIYRNAGWFPARQPLSTRFVVPRSVLRANVVIAVSENTAKDVVDIFGIPRSRIQVVPHGVAASFRPRSAEDLAAARARLKLPDRYILFVGTVEPRKNLETLLEAWAMMRDRPDLVVVGAFGWLYEPIRERMQRMGTGLHHSDGLDPADLPAVYNLARVLAHPAWYEGFGLPPLEAMACGTPVVVSERSSLPEGVDDAGLVVNAASPNEWRDTLERVIADTDLAADLRHRGILRAAQFSWSRSGRLTWQAIDRAIKSRG